jgi:hypothetical protein
MRTAILASALGFIGVLTALTVNVLVRTGFDVLVGFSLLIVALFGLGVVGALRHPPDQ